MFSSLWLSARAYFWENISRFSWNYPEVFKNSFKKFETISWNMKKSSVKNRPCSPPFSLKKCWMSSQARTAFPDFHWFPGRTRSWLTWIWNGFHRLALHLKKVVNTLSIFECIILVIADNIKRFTIHLLVDGCNVTGSTELQIQRVIETPENTVLSCSNVSMYLFWKLNFSIFILLFVFNKKALSFIRKFFLSVWKICEEIVQWLEKFNEIN